MFMLGSHVHTIDTLRSFKMGAKKKVGAVNANFQPCLLRTGDKEACTPTFLELLEAPGQEGPGQLHIRRYETVELRVEITTIGNVLVDLTAAPSSGRDPTWPPPPPAAPLPRVRAEASLEGLHLRLSPHQKPGSHCVFTEPADT